MESFPTNTIPATFNEAGLPRIPIEMSPPDLDGVTSLHDGRLTFAEPATSAPPMPLAPPRQTLTRPSRLTLITRTALALVATFTPIPILVFPSLTPLALFVVLLLADTPPSALIVILPFLCAPPSQLLLILLFLGTPPSKLLLVLLFLGTPPSKLLLVLLFPGTPPSRLLLVLLFTGTLPPALLFTLSLPDTIVIFFSSTIISSLAIVFPIRLPLRKDDPIHRDRSVADTYVVFCRQCCKRNGKSPYSYHPQQPQPVLSLGHSHSSHSW